GSAKSAPAPRATICARRSTPSLRESPFRTAKPRSSAVTFLDRLRVFSAWSPIFVDSLCRPLRSARKRGIDKEGNRQRGIPQRLPGQRRSGGGHLCQAIV